MLSQSEGCRCKENGGWRRQRLRCWHCWERQSLPGWQRLCRIHFTPMDRPQSCASLRCRTFLPAKSRALCLQTAPRPTQAAMLRWHCSGWFLSKRCVQSPRRGARCSCAVRPSGSSCFPMAHWSWHSLTGTRRWAARIPPRRRGCGWGISSSRQMGSRCAAMRI